MKNQAFKHSILTIALGSMLTACGGGGGGGGEATAVYGRAIDGALRGATVTFEDCNNQTTLTDSKGFFNFPVGCRESALTVSGGIDIATDLAFNEYIKAPKIKALQDGENIIIVSPLTTLIVAAGGSSKAAAILKALGLEGIDPFRTDPLSDKNHYKTNVAVEQAIEQIKKAIFSLDGDIDSKKLSNAAYSALAAALLANKGDPNEALHDVDLISAVIAGTLENIKDELPADIQAHLADVKINLAALLAGTIAKNIESVETAIEDMPDFIAGADNSDAIKAATKEAIVDAKSSNETTALVNALAKILTLPQDKVAALLKTISDAVNSGSADAADIILDALKKLQPIAASEGVTLELPADTPSTLIPTVKAYHNYLKLEGFSVQSSSYTASQLKASLTTPISVSNLNNVLVGVSAFGNQKNTSPTISAGLKITTATKSLSLTASPIQLKFDNNGVLIAADIPSGATIKVSSSLNTIGDTELTPINSINALEDGKIALTETVLRQLSSTLSSQLGQIRLSNETATVTAVIHAGNTPITVDDANNKPIRTIKYNVGNLNSFGMSAKFAVK